MQGKGRSKARSDSKRKQQDAAGAQSHMAHEHEHTRKITGTDGLTGRTCTRTHESTHAHMHANTHVHMRKAHRHTCWHAADMQAGKQHTAGRQEQTIAF